MALFTKLCLDTLMYYFLLVMPIISDTESAQKIFINLINENPLP